MKRLLNQIVISSTVFFRKWVITLAFKTALLAPLFIKFLLIEKTSFFAIPSLGKKRKKKKNYNHAFFLLHRTLFFLSLLSSLWLMLYGKLKVIFWPLLNLQMSQCIRQKWWNLLQRDHHLADSREGALNWRLVFLNYFTYPSQEQFHYYQNKIQQVWTWTFFYPT